jgi:peptide-methionine (S)-S-oxide reductase
VSPFLDDSASFDARMREAVAAVDAGDVATLERLIAEHPALVHQRLASPGRWLRDVVGRALDDFFLRPYLLWFVAEDPVRNGRLPANIAEVARTIIDAARRERAPNLQEQLDYAVTLVALSWIARDCGVQIALLDVLIDAGAALGGATDNALVNANVDAARHLVERGAPLTLATALCLGLWNDADRLATTASLGEKQFALVLSALNGRAEAVERALRAGADPSAPSQDLYSHATPLHHAVASGSLATVRALMEAGANLAAIDTAWNGTPLGWAEHFLSDGAPAKNGKEYAPIAGLLRSSSGRSSA